MLTTNRRRGLTAAALLAGHASVALDADAAWQVAFCANTWLWALEEMASLQGGAADGNRDAQKFRNRPHLRTALAACCTRAKNCGTTSSARLRWCWLSSGGVQACASNAACAAQPQHHVYVCTAAHHVIADEPFVIMPNSKLYRLSHRLDGTGLEMRHPSHVHIVQQSCWVHFAPAAGG